MANSGNYIEFYPSLAKITGTKAYLRAAFGKKGRLEEENLLPPRLNLCWLLLGLL